MQRRRRKRQTKRPCLDCVLARGKTFLRIIFWVNLFPKQKRCHDVYSVLHRPACTCEIDSSRNIHLPRSCTHTDMLITDMLIFSLSLHLFMLSLFLPQLRCICLGFAHLCERSGGEIGLRATVLDRGRGKRENRFKCI